VVDRVVQLLDLLAEAGQGVGVTEIAGRLRLGKSTTHRLLTSLARAGVVRVDPAARLYHLGYRLLQWTAGWLDRLDARTRALPHLRHLQEKCQETVSLNLQEELTRVAVERLETSQEVRFVADVGKPLPLHTGAGGKAILAFLPPPEIDRVLAAAALPTGAERALRRTLGDIRRSGSAVSFGERVPGSGAVSAPVFNHQGRVIGSVSILSVAVRLSPDTVRSHAELVRQAAGAISRDLGWPGREAATPARSTGQGRR
jgi:IclR family acetate operon transcriptional repressor